MLLGRLTWPQVDGRPGLVLLLPLGATEQHGPHLPLETDTVIATALAEAVATQRRDAVAAPALPFGASGEHAGFPGTLSLGRQALEHAVVELGRSADAFVAMVVVSWHGGNAEPVARAAARLRGEGRRVAVWRPRLTGGDAHAGRMETSLMLAIAPDLVRAARPRGATAPLAELLPALSAHGVRAVSPTGVLGDAEMASAQEGRELLSELAADLSAHVDAVLAATR